MSNKKDLMSLGQAYGDVLNRVVVREDKLPVPAGEVGDAPLESGGPEEKAGFRPSKIDITRMSKKDKKDNIYNIKGYTYGDGNNPGNTNQPEPTGPEFDQVPYSGIVGPEEDEEDISIYDGELFKAAQGYKSRAGLALLQRSQQELQSQGRFSTDTRLALATDFFEEDEEEAVIVWELNLTEGKGAAKAVEGGARHWPTIRDMPGQLWRYITNPRKQASLVPGRTRPATTIPDKIGSPTNPLPGIARQTITQPPINSVISQALSIPKTPLDSIPVVRQFTRPVVFGPTATTIVKGAEDIKDAYAAGHWRPGDKYPDGHPKAGQPIPNPGPEQPNIDVEKGGKGVGQWTQKKTEPTPAPKHGPRRSEPTPAPKPKSKPEPKPSGRTQGGWTKKKTENEEDEEFLAEHEKIARAGLNNFMSKTSVFDKLYNKVMVNENFGEEVEDVDDLEALGIETDEVIDEVPEEITVSIPGELAQALCEILQTALAQQETEVDIDVDVETVEDVDFEEDEEAQMKDGGGYGIDAGSTYTKEVNYGKKNRVGRLRPATGLAQKDGGGYGIDAGSTYTKEVNYGKKNKVGNMKLGNIPGA